MFSQARLTPRLRRPTDGSKTFIPFPAIVPVRGVRDIGFIDPVNRKIVCALGEMQALISWKLSRFTNAQMLLSVGCWAILSWASDMLLYGRVWNRYRVFDGPGAGGACGRRNPYLGLSQCSMGPGHHQTAALEANHGSGAELLSPSGFRGKAMWPTSETLRSTGIG